MLAFAASLAACGNPDDGQVLRQVKDAPLAQPAASTPAPADARTIVFLGDSLTAGYGLEPQDALPEQVAAVWQAKGLDVVAINAGVSGDTTANGLARFEWSVVEANADLVVIALGANDYLMGVPADVAKANLSAILERADAAGIPAVLVGVTLRGNVQPGSREADYEAIYPELSSAFDVPYYPSLLAEIAGDPSMLQPDGLHPTEAGVVKIAKPLAAFLEPLITETDPP